MLCSLLREPEQAAWFLLATGFLEAVTQQHQQWRPFPKQGPRCLPNSRFFSSRCEGDTLHCSDPLRTRKLWREWFYYSGHWLTPACLPSLRYWWLIWTGLLPERPINWQDRHDIELAQVIQVLIFFQHGTNGSILCSFLLWTGTGNMIPATDRFSGIRNRAASATKESSSDKGWGFWKNSGFVSSSLFWPFANGQNCSLTVVTPWHPRASPLFGNGAWYELDCYTNAPSTGKTGKTLN